MPHRGVYTVKIERRINIVRFDGIAHIVCIGEQQSRSVAVCSLHRTVVVVVH